MTAFPTFASLDPSNFNPTYRAAGGQRGVFLGERLHPWLQEQQQAQARASTARANATASLFESGILGSMFGNTQASTSSPAPAGGPSDYDGLRASLLGELEGYGDSRREDVNRAYDTTLDSTLARLHDRGFGNSSLVENTTQQTERNRQSSLTELEDSLIGNRVDVLSGVGLAGLQSNDRFRLAAMQPQLNFQSQLLSSLLGV